MLYVKEPKLNDKIIFNQNTVLFIYCIDVHFGYFKE